MPAYLHSAEGTAYDPWERSSSLTHQPILQHTAKQHKFFKEIKKHSKNCYF